MRQENNALPRTAHSPRKTYRKRRSPILVITVLLCIALPLLSIYFMANGRHDDVTNSSQIGSSSTAIQEREPQVPARQYQMSQPQQAYSQENGPDDILVLTFGQLAEISNDHLLLVNIDYAIPPYITGNLVRVSDYVRALSSETLINEYVLAMLRVMFDSAEAVGFTQFRVTQGFRTHEYQQNLFDTAANQSLVALPGHSEHQVGLAVDISYEGVNIGNSAQGTWLMENSYRYGFILRYPAHKTEITRVPFEPWHYRYVGQPHAYFMTKNDLVLEEYIDLLRVIREIAITFNGTVYRIFYLSDHDDVIEIPKNHGFWASLDNTGGIIVTMWANY